MKLIKILKNFFKATKADAILITARDAFSVARLRYEQTQQNVAPHNTRAKHRAVIMNARMQYDKTKDRNDYEKRIAQYTDPADLAHYTEAELDEYTVAIEKRLFSQTSG